MTEVTTRVDKRDYYEVLEIDDIAGAALPQPPTRCGMLTALRHCSERLSRCTARDDLLRQGAE